MNPISRIRARLGVSQAALAAVLNVTQSNVSNYEHGQEMPPKVARRLIAYANGVGHAVTFEDIYGSVATPLRRATDPMPAPGHCGRQPASPHNILDTVPDGAVVVQTGYQVASGLSKG